LVKVEITETDKNKEMTGNVSEGGSGGSASRSGRRSDNRRKNERQQEAQQFKPAVEERKKKNMWAPTQCEKTREEATWNNNSKKSAKYKKSKRTNTVKNLRALHQRPYKLGD